MDTLGIPLNIVLLIISFIYAVIISFFFFSRRRVKTKENQLFGFMLIINIVCILLEVLCVYSMDIFNGINPSSLFVNRIFLVGLILYEFSTVLYALNLSEVYSNIPKILPKIIRLLIYFFIVVGSIAVFFLDIDLYNQDGKLYSFGPAVNLVFAYGFVSFISCLIYLLLTFKSTSKVVRSKSIPIIFFVLFTIVTTIIQKKYPYITLANSVGTIVNLLIYHSLENPMFNELAIAKNVATEANSAKKDFLSSMSHEIRTPLNAIVGLSQYLEQTDDIEEVHNTSKEMFVASHTLLDIIDSILDANSISANEMEIENKDYELRKELDTVTHIIDVMIMNKDLKLETNYASDLPVVLNGDIHKIKRIMTNLLTNAVKYTDKGFVYFNVSCINKNNMCYLKMEVKDTGRGMSEEQKEKLFQQFYRLEEDKDSDISGVGLGLSITKSFVDLMKGKIEVETIPDLGTKVIIDLPQKIIKLKEDNVETL